MNRIHSRGLSVIILGLLISMGCSEQDAASPAQTRSESNAPAAATKVDYPTLKARLVAILNEPDRMTRVGALLEALSEVPESEAHYLREILEDRDVRFRELERVLVVSRWAKFDPVAASEYSMKKERGPSREAAIEESIMAWARIDPEAVVQKYDIEALAKGKTSLLTGLIEGWFDSGKYGLTEFVFAIGSPEIRVIGYRDLTRVRLVREGIEPTIEWAEGVDVRAKNLFYREAAREVAKVDAAAAVKWCERICDGEHGLLVSHWIVRGWAPRDGAAMMDWLLTRPDEQDTWVAARIGFREFVIAEEEKAWEWMENTTEEQRMGNILQGPVMMYAHTLKWRKPELGLEWTKYINDEDQRRRNRIQIVRTWRKDHPEEALAWLEQSELSESDREQALGDGRITD